MRLHANKFGVGMILINFNFLLFIPWSEIHSNPAVIDLRFTLVQYLVWGYFGLAGTRYNMFTSDVQWGRIAGCLLSHCSRSC